MRPVLFSLSLALPSCDSKPAHVAGNVSGPPLLTHSASSAELPTLVVAREEEYTSADVTLKRFVASPRRGSLIWVIRTDAAIGGPGTCRSLGPW